MAWSVHNKPLLTVTLSCYSSSSAYSPANPDRLCYKKIVIVHHSLPVGTADTALPKLRITRVVLLVINAHIKQSKSFVFSAASPHAFSSKLEIWGYYQSYMLFFPGVMFMPFKVIVYSVSLLTCRVLLFSKINYICKIFCPFLRFFTSLCCMLSSCFDQISGLTLASFVYSPILQLFLIFFISNLNIYHEKKRA